MKSNLCKRIFPLALTLTLSLTLTCTFAQDFNMQFRSHVAYPGYTCSSEWGYVDSLGNEYALVGTSFGVSIVDITNPDSPKVKFNVMHTPSFWREIKTYGHYAYATNEDGGGLLVMDLSQLPDTFYQYSFIYTDPNGVQQNDGHELWIDEHGRLYIYGGAYSNGLGVAGGATMFDLTADPINPPFLGAYENHYIHSGFVRGDTLWASEIFNQPGQLEIVDVSDPLNCIPMGIVTTPNGFTHNSCPTHDDHYVFTTDEVSGAYVTAYDVSDLSNITEVDRVQSNPGTTVIPHNVHLLNDTFAVTAYYCDGVVVFDVSHPDNMIKVASYDTWPFTCSGYNGTWGAYPYLPSGNIILSNIEDGLFVVTPKYIQACRLEGNIIDSISGASLFNVNVQILNTGVSTISNLSGNYKTGYAYSGNYDAVFSYPGYGTRIIPVTLNHGEVTIANVKMKSDSAASFNGQILDSATFSPVALAKVNVSDGILENNDATSNAYGEFSLGYQINTGDVLMTSGLWGYKTRQQVVSVTDPAAFAEMKIPEGYYDDFFFDESWNVSGSATSGEWVRVIPIGTNVGGVFYNPSADAGDDFGRECYVTGNNGGNPGDDDIDDGYTRLTSPIFDLSNYLSPMISYEYWLATDDVTAVNDSLVVFLSNGNTTVEVAAFTPANSPLSQWVHREFRVTDFMQPTGTMTISFYAVDNPGDNVFESAIDRFDVSDSTIVNGIPSVAIDHLLKLFPNPFYDQSVIQYNLSSLQQTDFSIEVFNMVGQKIKTIPLNSPQGTLYLGNDFTDGIYLLKLVADGKMIDQLKAVKTR